MSVIEEFITEQRSNIAGLIILMIFALFVYLFGKIQRSRTERKTRRRLQSDAEARMRREEWRRGKEDGFYRFLLSIPWLGDVIYQFQEQIYYITPYGRNELGIVSVRLLEKCMILSTGAAVVTFFANIIARGTMDLLCIVVTLIAAWVTFAEYSSWKIYSLQDIADKELCEYLAHVKHDYFAHKKAGESVLAGADGMGYEMRLRARDLYEIIRSSNAKDRVFEYVNDQKRGMFLRLFLIQAYHSSKIGDKWENGESLFCKNIDILRRDIPIFRMRRKERREQFSGATLMVVLPLLIMNILRSYGAGFSSDMVEFYDTTGYLIQVLNVFVTVLVYDFFRKKKTLSNNYSVQLGNAFIDRLGKVRVVSAALNRANKTHFAGRLRERLSHIGADIGSKLFILKMLTMGAAAVVIVMSFFIYGHVTRRIRLTTSVVDNEFMSTVSDRQSETVGQTIVALVNRYKGTDPIYLSESVLVEDIDDMTNLRSLSLKTGMASVVISQVRAYRDEHLKWYEVLIAVLSCLTAFIPYIELVHYNNMTKQAKEEEVKMFQMIVLLEREFRSTSVIGLLTEFESHAVYFREKLRRAIVMYSRSREEALDMLYDYDSPEFMELVQSLKAVFKCGVKAAFSETEMDMVADAEMQRLDSRIAARKSADIADILKVIPAVIAFGTYFLVPFLWSAIGSVAEVFEVLQTLN